MPKPRFICGAQYAEGSGAESQVVEMSLVNDAGVLGALVFVLPKKSCTIASPGFPGQMMASSGSVCEQAHRVLHCPAWTAPRRKSQHQRDNQICFHKWLP